MQDSNDVDSFSQLTLLKITIGSEKRKMLMQKVEK